MTKNNYPELLELQDVISIHDLVIQDYGGRSGIHNLGMLESALNHPLMVLVYGNDEEKELSALAAIYFFHIIKNHPFADGNKRTGFMATIQFLDLNGFELKKPLNDLYDDLYELAIQTAESKTNKKEIAEFFKRLMKKK